MLVEKVYNLNSFQRQYEALLTLSVCDTIPNLIWNKDKSSLLSLIDWDNMLSIASLFCYSEENKYVDAALRIAQTCIMPKMYFSANFRAKKGCQIVGVRVTQI